MFSKAPQYIGPEALAMIQEIYNEITQLPWFPKHSHQCEQFAIDMISFCENGLTGRGALRQIALARAEEQCVPRNLLKPDWAQQVVPGM